MSDKQNEYDALPPTIMELTDIQQICLENNLPFFAYRLPMATDVVTGIQLTPDVRAFAGFGTGNSGFVAVPFDPNSRAGAVWIGADILFQNKSIAEHDLAKLKQTRFTAHFKPESGESISKNEYLNQAEQLIEQLQRGELDKVVLSRTIGITTDTKPKSTEIFAEMCKCYPNAYVSLFFVPGKCLWLGATPETLLTATDKKLTTMSLAGTKVANPSVLWTDKERVEQEMVSRYVEDVLTDFSFSKIIKDGPAEHLAGNLTHLMTRYECEGILSMNELTRLVDRLHPTPAVCGLPKQKSMEVIRETEKHDREYYAGYIGFVSNNKIQLFVNLRCMKIDTNSITCYVGGGLTAQSNAHAEWEETCLKAETLMRILKINTEKE